MRYIVVGILHVVQIVVSCCEMWLICGVERWVVAAQGSLASAVLRGVLVLPVWGPEG